MSKEIFARIAGELDSGKLDPALWTRAFAECDGDKEKARAMYIRLRHDELSELSMASATKPPLTKPDTPTAPSSGVQRPPASALDELRERLHGLQVASGKATLYQNIGLNLRSSDAEIAAALERFKRTEAAGELLRPEVRYAMEALGTPTARERYDRNLFGMLNNPAGVYSASSPGGAVQMAPDSTSRLNPALVMAGVALLAALGYGSGLFGSRETKKVSVVEAGAVKNQATAIEYAAEIENRALAIKEQAEARQREQMLLRQAQVESQQWQAENNRRLQLEEREKRDSLRKDEDERRRTEAQNRRIAQEVHQRAINDARARGNTTEVERLLSRGPSYY